MTHPRVLNTFAIPKPAQSADQEEATFEYADDWPINPWLVHGHELLWAPIDNTEAEFHRFTRELPSPERLYSVVAGEGHLVIVSGEVGTGKSSLINRCVNHVATQLTTSSSQPEQSSRWALKKWPPNVHFVPIGGIGAVDDGIYYGAADSIIERADKISRRIYEAILKKILAQPIVRNRVESEGILAELRLPDTLACFERLSGLLTSLGNHVLVMIPKVRKRSREIFDGLLRACLHYSLPGIIIFMECSMVEVGQRINDVLEEDELRRVSHLKIGEPNEDDHERFLQVRTSPDLWHSPRLGVAENTFAGPRPELNYLSVGGLQKIFFGAADKVISTGVETTLTVEHVVAYQDPNDPWDPSRFLRTD